MKSLFTSDLHGYWPHYSGLIDMAFKNNLDAIFIGGDLFPRKGHDQHSLTDQIHFIKNEFVSFLETLNKISDTKVFIIPGNNDWAKSFEHLSHLDVSNLIILPYDEYVEFHDHFILGYPFVPPTPFTPKDFEKKEYAKDNIPNYPDQAYFSTQNGVQAEPTELFFNQRNTIEDDLNLLINRRLEKPVIAIMHAPPYQTALDHNHSNQTLGSIAIRQWIEKTQPMLTFHGHIHESPVVTGQFWDRIGDTLCLCSGQTPQKLFAIIIDLNDIKTIRHTEFGQIQ